MKYVPFITTCIDDAFGTQVHTEYDSDNLFDTYEEACDALDEIADESEGLYGIFAIDEEGNIAHQYNHGNKSDDEADIEAHDEFFDCFDCDRDDLEMGFNPYMGCYDFDC